jgi:BRCA1-associated protein
MNMRLMERIEFLTKEMERLKAAKLDLEERNHDLAFFIRSSEKPKEAGEDVQEGTVTVPDPPTAGWQGEGRG